MRTFLLILLTITFTRGAAAQSPAQGCPGYVSGPVPYSLRAALQASCIPLPTNFDLDTSIQSASYNGTSEFVLAYQSVTAPDKLQAQPLHLMRYDKQSKQWATAEIQDFRTELLPGLNDQCSGSVDGVQKAGALFHIGIHLSPSASCELVVSDDLKLNAVLGGWVVASFSSGALVLQGNMIHFAPTHPLTLLFFDPRTVTATTIYPPKADALRSTYVQLLSKIPPSDRCREENCESDPERFDNELNTIAVNDKTGSLAFTVTFSPVGFVLSEALQNAKHLDEQVTYVYQFFPRPIEYRAFKTNELETRFGTTALDKLLNPGVLARVFAK